MSVASRGDGRALLEVAGVFLRLGLTGFGGPAAHVALMEAELVRRRAWIAREEFLDVLAASQLIPGPNSTELAMHIGQRRAGLAGLIVAGTAFILPAALLSGLAAWVYVRHGTLPAVAHVLSGVQPVVLALVAQAVFTLARPALRTRALLALAAAAAVANAAGADELLVLAAAGALAVLAHAATRPRGTGVAALVPFALPVPAAATAASALGLAPLFLVFLKIGCVLFGSGYVLVAFLRAELVTQRGWLTETQLLDAVAVGQFTPGPLFSAATFIGGLLAGAPGAALATLGIFLPAYVLVALSGPLVPRLRRSPAAGAFLDGVIAASVALMAVVTVRLGPAVLTDPLAGVSALAALVALVRFRVSPMLLMLAGAVLGALRG